MPERSISPLIVRTSCRIDLVGGTLDIWPISAILSPALTINFAIHLGHIIRVQMADRWVLTNVGQDASWSPGQGSPPEDFQFPWFILRSRESRPCHLSIETQIPRGSGLGGSSALAVGLVAAMERLHNKKIRRDSLVKEARFLETQFLSLPTGIQDYLPAVYGGFHAWTWTPDGWSRHNLRPHFKKIHSHLMLVYLGVSHFSGRPNWEIFKGFIEGDREVRQAMLTIRDASLEFLDALIAGDKQRLIRSVRNEMAARASLHPSVLDNGVEEALKIKCPGVLAVRVCGAGGGGCVIFWIEPSKRDAIRDAILQRGWMVIEPVRLGRGLLIQSARDV